MIYTHKICRRVLVVARWCRRDSRLSFLEFQSAQGRTLGKRGSNRRENGSLYIQSRYNEENPSIRRANNRARRDIKWLLLHFCCRDWWRKLSLFFFFFTSPSYNWRSLLRHSSIPPFERCIFWRDSVVCVRPPWLSTEVACHSSCRLQTIIPTASAIHMHARF